QSYAELGLPALLLAGGEPGRAPWVVATGHADLDRSEPLPPGSLFPVPGLTGLVTGTAVLRLVASGQLGLDDPANRHLRTVSLADDTITITELPAHTPRRPNPEEDSEQPGPGPHRRGDGWTVVGRGGPGPAGHRMAVAGARGAGPGGPHPAGRTRTARPRRRLRLAP